MKRNFDSTAVDSQNRPKIQRRQDPVSCNLCRSKKLKCDRINPCSNCTARKTKCVFISPYNLNLDGQTQRESSSETISFQSNESVEGTASSTNHERNSTFDSRLRRLENLASSFSAPSSSLNQPNISAFENLRPHISGPSGISNSSSSIGSDLVQSSEAMIRDQHLLDTANKLESVAINCPSVYSILESNMGPTSPSERLASSLFTIPQMPALPSKELKLTCSQILLILPSFELATAIFQNYIEQVSWVYHILHIPTTRAQLTDLYARLHTNQDFDIDKLGLLATILGTSAYFWSPSPSSFSSPNFKIPKCLRDFSRSDAVHSVQRWSQLAHYCLRQADYIAKPTIETIQAVIILSHFLLPNEGSTLTYTVLLSMMVHSAHILNIHQIDSKKSIKERENRLRRGEKIDMINLELKRRIWWHLVSSDWILTYFSGPQSGTYVVQPSQFHVLYPLNTDDSAITSASAPNSLDISLPTDMSYFIFRCKLSCVFREIVDYATSADLEVEDIPYDAVLDFDKKCRDLLRELPFWLQLDPKSRAKSKKINAERPYTAMYRLLAHFGVHTRLGRLHRPYLIRGSRDPKYAYSRMMCLRSARTVIELEKQMQQEFGVRDSWPKLMWFITHHLFVSTVILGMDYCFNQDDLGNEIRKQEIMECFRTLERSKEESEIAKRGVEQLKMVLREWRGKVDGDLRPISRGRVSSSPGTDSMDKNHINEELDGFAHSALNIPSAATSSVPVTAIPKKTQEMNEMPNMNIGGAGASFEEDRIAGFETEEVGFDWFSSLDFDPEASAGVDWETLFKDLEGRSGMLEGGS